MQIPEPISLDPATIQTVLTTVMSVVSLVFHLWKKHEEGKSK